jgi:hypothetical protein
MRETESQTEPRTQESPEPQTNDGTVGGKPSNATRAAKKTSTKATRQKAGRKASGRRRKKSNKKESQTTRARGRPGKPYPTATFESALPLAKMIFERAGASREMKRVTVFELLGRGSESSTSRALVVNSARYGLTAGGIQAEILRLKDEAVPVLSPTTPATEATRG